MLNNMMDQYFKSFNSAIVMFSDDARWLQNSAAMTPQLDQDKRFSLYLDLTQDYFNQMRDGISYDFLARANGIDLMKKETYDVQISKSTRRELNIYSRTKPASELDSSIVYQTYTTDMEKEARKAGMSFGNYVVVQEESLSPLEKKLANVVKSELANFDKSNAQRYYSLSSASALSLAEACQKIPQQDFYTLYNGSRKTIDRYFGWKIADAFYNSGYKKDFVLDNKDKFLTKFYQYAMTHDGYQKLTGIANIRQALQESTSVYQEQNVETQGSHLKK